MRIRWSRLAVVAVAAVAFIAIAATIVPKEVELPGTQPREVTLESPDKCDNCHGNYNTTVEPAHNWRGSMMANATRDPLFWATLAVAEQDFDGVGDLCIRCHSTSGWLAGRSSPTDGSALTASDADGVECDYCHKLTNPDKSEHQGVQNAPYIANNGATPPVGYYGSGMGVLWGGSEKLGPYSDAQARHQEAQSKFHRKSELCGTCHDVSNSVVGDLAHNNGAQVPLPPGAFSGQLGSDLTTKAAFKNFPFAYGIVERTFSEHKASALSDMLVSGYASLPEEMKTGAIKVAYESSIVAGTGGNYADNTPRHFSCQTCHMRPVTGQGCNKNPPVRKDLPLHDMTGGNYWVPDAIKYLNAQGKLLAGGGMTVTQLAALDDGKTRAMKQLSEAAAVSVSGNNVRIVNLTGHKLITGYPEGRRMWLNVKWYDSANTLLREDGKYGAITTTINGTQVAVDTLTDLNDPNTKIYEAHYGMTQEWAKQLVDIGHPGGLPLSYDRTTGAITYTLAELAAAPAGTVHETFHFALNNTVIKDNRIPPYGMKYDTARTRNALPVPAAQYGSPTTGGTYNNYDVLTLNPPANAAYAEVKLMYQPTSWEYIQFLHLANDGSKTFLANEGANLLEAWRNTGMAAPYVMATAFWGTPPAPPTLDLVCSQLGTYALLKDGSVGTATSTFTVGSSVGIRAVMLDNAAKPVSGVQAFIDVADSGGKVVSTLQGFTDANGVTVVKWSTNRKTVKGTYTATVKDALKSGYTFKPAAGTTTVTFTIQ